MLVDRGRAVQGSLRPAAPVLEGRPGVRRTVSAPMAAFSLERDVGLMVVGRLAPRAPDGAGRGSSTARAPTSPTTTSISPTRCASWPRRSGRCRRPRGTSRGTCARCCRSAPPATTTWCRPTSSPAPASRRRAPTSTATDAIDNVAVWQGGLELRALWRGAALQAEWFGRLEDPGAAAAQTAPTGAATSRGATSSCRTGCRSAARVGHTDLPLYGATAAERQLARHRQNEQSGAVSAYLRGHRIKVQVDYSHLTSDGADAPPARTGCRRQCRSGSSGNGFWRESMV